MADLTNYQQLLEPPTPGVSGQFGCSVDVDGDYMVVGEKMWAAPIPPHWIVFILGGV